MTLDSFLRKQGSKMAEPFAEVCSRAGISPNSLSVASLLFAVLAGFLFYFSKSLSYGLPLAAAMVAVSAALDGIDGTLARMVGATVRGDFLDHVLDRYADVFIVGGIIFGGYSSMEVGIFALVGILLTSYLGTQAQAVNVGRYYGGVLGRADRLAMIFSVTLVNWAYPKEIGYGIYGMLLLGWMMVFIAVVSNFTALQRFAGIWKKLSERK